MLNYIRLSCGNGELARNRIIFSVLADDTVAALEKICRNKTIRAGDVIFRQGDDATHYFGVTSGVIKLVKSLANGTQIIVGLPDAPELCGPLPEQVSHLFSRSGNRRRTVLLPQRTIRRLFENAS